MNCSTNNERTGLSTVAAQRPAAFGVAAVAICLAVFSTVSAAPASPVLAAPAVATVLAGVFYMIGRSAFWMRADKTACNRHFPKLLVAGALIAAAASLATGLAFSGEQPRPSDIVLDPPLLIVGICILTGIYEELLFRGVLFGALRRYYGTGEGRRIFTMANTVQSLVFALAHVMGGFALMMQTPSIVAAAQIAIWLAGTFLFGIVMGKLLESTRTIALNCALHACYDFVLFAPLAFSTGRLRTEMITGDPTDLAVFAIQAGILALTLLVFIRRP